jgi:hypothetical protein
MGNVAETYFPQYVWGMSGRYQRGVHTLVTGQEDPRTLTLGHTIHLNIERPVRFPDDYLNYHRVFEAVADQGGISGFAHASGGLQGTTEGMTVQAAFGLLDFGEVMQASELGTDGGRNGLPLSRSPRRGTRLRRDGFRPWRRCLVLRSRAGPHLRHERTDPGSDLERPGNG